MLTVRRMNGVPARRSVYTWPFEEDFFRPLAEMVASPMRTGVKETEDAYLFDAELPGFEPSEVDLSVLDGVLTIVAEHREGNEDSPAFATRTVRRSFTIGDVDEENITARYRNGVLRVTLPKLKQPEAPAARKIALE